MVPNRNMARIRANPVLLTARVINQPSWPVSGRDSCSLMGVALSPAAHPASTARDVHPHFRTYPAEASSLSQGCLADTERRTRAILRALLARALQIAHCRSQTEAAWTASPQLRLRGAAAERDGGARRARPRLLLLAHREVV